MQTNLVAAYPLSPLQQGMLFHTLYAPQSGVDVEQLVLTLPLQLDVVAFQYAWETVVARHPVFRTRFRWQTLTEPLQEVFQTARLPLVQHDCSHLSEIEQIQQFEEYIKFDRRLGFRLDEAPLMRVTIFKLDTAKFRCLWTFHHILLDGRSFPVVLREVFTLYQTACQGQAAELPPAQPYQTYIAWLQHQNMDKSETFWREQLRGIEAPTPLVVDQAASRSAKQADSYSRQTRQLSASLTSNLRSLAEQHELTVNTFVQGAWAILLSRYSGQAEVVFGVTRAGRHTTVAGAEEMVGLFINTLPLRVHVPSDSPLLTWLTSLRAQNITLRDYEHTPLVKIQSWSDIPGDQPLFESILVFENYRLDSWLQQQGNDWANCTIELFEQTNYPLTINAYLDAEFWLEITYNDQRFSHSVIERMLGHLEVLLTGMTTALKQPLVNLSLLTEAECSQLLVEWNDTKRDYPPDLCLPQLFEAQVARTPDAIALTFADETLTYRELNQRANQLAHYLRAQCVGPEVLVGIFMERSFEMVISLYAIIKAGGAYVPLDPEYPPERVAFMLQDAQVPVLLTQQRLLSNLPDTGATILCVDADWANIAEQSTENSVSGVSADNLAYVIFTSGSTGRPKGVMNTHKGICNRLLWMQEAYQLTPSDRVLQKTPFSFDVSVWEFFWPLFVGARLVIAQPGGHKDRNYLVNLIVEQQISTVHFVPSMLQIFLEAKDVSRCRSLERVICSGEALPYELQKSFFAHLTAELHNLYGPTEAAVDVTYWACQRNGSHPIVPIGRPVANTQIYILDAHLQPVPMGVPGELHIGGVQVARGYLNRPQLTAEKFIHDPFFSPESGARSGGVLYKTGDKARYLPDGSIEYLGRFDHQVKIRGFRIELGEIEAILGQHAAVKETIVMAQDTEQTPQQKVLMAYLVPASGRRPTVENLRTFLSKKLPDYMIPAAFVMLEAMPLTPNGKANRGALPLPDLARPLMDQPYVAPQNETEVQLTEIWSEVLRIKRVGIHDNFFELGGHSLLATQAIARIQQKFQIDLPLHALFEAPTVATFAEKVAQREIEQFDAETLAHLLTTLEEE